MSDNETVTHHRVCHLCEAMCGLVIQTKGAKVVDIRGDRADPLSRGHICPKAVAIITPPSILAPTVSERPMPASTAQIRTSLHDGFASCASRC